MSAVKIELQYIDGCANASVADLLLRSVIEDLAPDASYERIEVKSEAEGREIGFHGSPTIRVNGVDIDGATGPGAGFS